MSQIFSSRLLRQIKFNLTLNNPPYLFCKKHIYLFIKCLFFLRSWFLYHKIKYKFLQILSLIRESYILNLIR